MPLGAIASVSDSLGVPWFTSSGFVHKLGAVVYIGYRYHGPLGHAWQA